MDTRNVRTFVDNKTVAWETAGAGIRRKILAYDERLMLVVVEFDEGAVGYPHHHPHSQISYVVKGSFEVEIDRRKKVLKAGDSFYVPSDSVHGAVALEPSVLIDTFAPMREDFVTDGRT